MYTSGEGAWPQQIASSAPGDQSGRCNAAGHKDQGHAPDLATHHHPQLSHHSIKLQPGKRLVVEGECEFVGYNALPYV